MGPTNTEMQARHLADQLITRERNPNPSNQPPTEPFCSKAAARLLHVSLRQLSRMMLAGTVTYSKGPSRWDAVTFTYADIGLQKPVEIAIAAPQSDEPKAAGTTAPPKMTAAQQPGEPEPVSPEPVSPETFRSSSG